MEGQGTCRSSGAEYLEDGEAINILLLWSKNVSLRGSEDRQPSGLLKMESLIFEP